MPSYSKGDQVVSIKDIGGFSRDSVPKGTPGVVIDEGGWGSSLRVQFRIDGGWFSSDSVVQIEVNDDEVQ